MQIKISEVLSLLESGKTRAEIREHFDLSHAELKLLFSHPSLKGRRTKQAPRIEIIDDTTESVDTAQISILDVIAEETEESIATQQESIEENEIESEVSTTTEEITQEDSSETTQWSY